MNESTVKFVRSLGELKEGDLGLLRKLRGRRLDESLPGFDLFSGLWWPLRSISPKTPRRKVVWLVTKLFAEFRFEQKKGASLPWLMGRICRGLKEEKEFPRVLARFDRLLTLELNQLEEPLAQVLAILKRHDIASLDWVALIDDLSAWERESNRAIWSDTFISAFNNQQGGIKC
ncbi:MAG TPA: type I-E CRISPR-associated protein Cse2/CasB [Candidatus Syntrophosphaera sp.]|jgi:CRISPR type I-E-associated protein CasB/Cse2|nr:type I-E CRISPR-associated protein Cse2/CasB [Candidatus Syntrophosphaera sp.]HQC42992.1 type I-E CRISPR-associated protein Cse2/CasB [Verrucomicrobiota bacterium]HQO68261.1 type I-E CRISPR-associated protein Cse2/CasB [Candidatus Syntrophosphaera sp.]